MCEVWREKGNGNANLNVAYSADDGATFGNKLTSATALSAQAPAMVAQNGTLYVAWKGEGNDNVNVGRVVSSGASSLITGW